MDPRKSNSSPADGSPSPKPDTAGASVAGTLPSWLRLRASGVEVSVRVVPKASRERVLGLHGDRLKIQIMAPPVAGAANQALIRFMAKAVRVAPSKVRVVVGAKDRSKTVLLEVDDPADVARRLAAVLAPGA